MTIIHQSGVIVSARQAGTKPTPKLQANTAFASLVGPTSYFPIASFRIRTDGDYQKAEGSTQAPLSYSNTINNQWDDAQVLTAGDYEAYLDTVTNSATGASATWSGSPRDQWVNCGSQLTWSKQKDTTSTGTGTHVCILEIREVGNASNTSGTFNQTFTVNIDL